jgi:hypothetical protein
MPTSGLCRPDMRSRWPGLGGRRWDRHNRLVSKGGRTTLSGQPTGAENCDGLLMTCGDETRLPGHGCVPHSAKACSGPPDYADPLTPSGPCELRKHNPLRVAAA